MRILIIGGGVAAQRYVESLIWTKHNISISGTGVVGKSIKLSEEYNLSYLEFDSLSEKIINGFEMLIICNSLAGKFDVVSKTIKKMKYENSLIIEKPLCISKWELKNYYDLLRPIEKCAIVCQRDFDLTNYKINESDSYNVIWYSIKESLFDNIIHMLPHLLSWILLEVGNDIRLKIIQNHLIGSVNGKKLEVFFERSEQNSVIINGIQYISPNYRMLNSRIVEEVQSFQKKDTIENLERAMIVTKLVCELMEDKE